MRAPRSGRMALAFAAFLAAVPIPCSALAGEEPPSADSNELLVSLEEIEQMSLADLLHDQTEVASVVSQSQLASPGILTVITRAEILASGARDLIDVLRQVPGFDFGADVQCAVGLGFRGLWGYEGKVLLLVDGHEMNEGLYLTTQLGNRFPVDQIERIEIIRGPGSVSYGGSAELAVIDIQTRRGKQLDGAAASLRYGQMDGGYARRNLSVAWGDYFEQLGGLEISATGFLGQSRTSGLDYTDFSGTSYSMRTSSAADPAFLSLNAALHGLELSFLYDGYSTLNRTNFGESLPHPTRIDYPGYFASARYELRLGDELSISPSLRYKHQSPFRLLDSDQAVREDNYYDGSFERLDGKLSVAWRPITSLHLLGGAQALFDRADPTGALDPAADETVSYRTLAGFAQALWENPIADLTAGARYEHNSAFGSSFVPRVGLTREIGSLHLKALYDDAYKAPSVADISSNPEIKPEKTRVFELEAGYLFADCLYAAVNLFDMTIDGPIVYDVDPATGVESYVNFKRTGVGGVEAQLRFKNARGSASLSYSFYDASKNEVPLFSVPGKPSEMLGLAQHKVAATGQLELMRGLSLAPSLVFLSGRSAYASADEDGNPLLERVAANWLLDLNLSYRPRNLEGITLGASVHNLLDQRVAFLQPYDGGHAPLPGMGREIGVRLAYER